MIKAIIIAVSLVLAFAGLLWILVWLDKEDADDDFQDR